MVSQLCGPQDTTRGREIPSMGSVCSTMLQLAPATSQKVSDAGNVGYNMKRVLVLDWDIHHGDGTQSIFLSDPNCLFISIHRYDRGTYYPASEDGHVTCQGVDSGKGLTVNICLDYVNEKFQEYKFQSPGDNDYIYIYHRILEPILKTYDPEFILISSGFDAAAGDPLGGFSITANGYFYLTRRLMELNSKVLAVL